MPRRGFIPKREVLPDPVYGTVIVAKLINQIMYDGKRGVAQTVCYKAFEEVARKFDRIDLLINNAVTTSPDVEKDFFNFNLDYVAKVVDVTAVGPLRVIQKFFPLLENTDDMSLIINISSEAGSISKCYRNFYVDYGMAKAALNMGTMTIWNNIKDNDKVNIFAIHPGWIRTNGRDDNPAPLSSYDAAEILRNLFEERRYDKTGHRFITNEGSIFSD